MSDIAERAVHTIRANSYQRQFMKATIQLAIDEAVEKRLEMIRFEWEQFKQTVSTKDDCFKQALDGDDLAIVDRPGLQRLRDAIDRKE